MSRIVVAGARGMLGRAVAGALRAYRHNVVEWDVAEGDLSDEKTVAWMMDDMRPGVVINCAGYTDVEGAEDPANLDAARRANVDIPAHLARACAKKNRRFVHISTDYVFDGTARAPITEDAEPNPISVYARTKLDGERAVLESGAQNAVIIRTAWLYGRLGRNFVDTIRRKAREHHRLEVVNDQTGCPTYATDLAETIVRVTHGVETGIFNAVNAGQATWYDLACAVVELAGIEGVEVVPCTSDRYPTKAKRPAYSVLDCSRLTRAIGFTMRPWREALRDYLTGSPA
ncbi:MAG: dTDP-4-dehydrorhamnose reductase [Deltaproteobacteria bacterium]|nr:dTDP-4-dehydrorhamnose reductase [Deltaproteobacteria bacterium]